MSNGVFLSNDDADQFNQVMDEARTLLASQLPLTCSECFYFTKDRTCRRHAPTVIINSSLPVTVYPRVQPSDFSCGDAVKGTRTYPDGK